MVQAPSSCVSRHSRVSVLCNVKLRSAESSRRGFGPGGWGLEGSSPCSHTSPLRPPQGPGCWWLRLEAEGSSHEQQGNPLAAASILYLKVMSSVVWANTPTALPSRVLSNTDTGPIVPDCSHPSACRGMGVGQLEPSQGRKTTAGPQSCTRYPGTQQLGFRATHFHIGS